MPGTPGSQQDGPATSGHPTPSPAALPGYPAAGYPAPGPAAPVPDAAATSYLDLTVQGNRFTSSMIAPHVTVNGHPLKQEYGYRRVPVPAGPVRIDVECRWSKTYGQASMLLDLAPGQAVPVFYAAPATVFSKGKIGHEKQSRAGMWVLLAILGIAVALPVMIGTIAVLANL